MKDRSHIICPVIILVIVILSLFIPFASAHADEECQCFPHAEGWARVEQHGLWVLANNADPYCTECHGTDLKGGWTGISCYQCHASYPHPQDWQRVEQHGAYTVRNGLAENCQNACHGTDFNGGYAQKSCYDCHELYPHPVAWADDRAAGTDDHHGISVMENKHLETRKCSTQCHGGQYEGGLSGVSCFDCHGSYPHGYNWSSPQVHGGFAVENGVAESCATGCHGVRYDGGQTEISCYGCHQGFPHRGLTLENHRTRFQKGDLRQCATLCHGADLRGGLSQAVNCRGCHGPAKQKALQP